MPEQDRVMYDVNTFCDAYRISRSKFYALQRNGRGPQMIKIDSKSLIAKKDAQRWADLMKARTMDVVEAS